MSRLLLRALLRLYPPGWRERYGEEYDALLEEHGADLRTLADVAAGAVDARLGGGRMPTRERRQRSALAASLWAAVAIAACVAGFQKMVEYDDFRSAAAHHPPVAAGRDLILGGAVVVAAAACLAGLVLGNALWRDLRRPPRGELVRPLLLAGAATAAFILGLAALVVYAHESAASRCATTRQSPSLAPGSRIRPCASSWHSRPPAASSHVCPSTPPDCAGWCAWPGSAPRVWCSPSPGC